jgi:ATP synthase protein I
MGEKDDFSKDIDKSAKGLMKARKEKGTFWRYVYVLGIGGWLLALPIVGGAFLGKYLDKKFVGSGSISWTITFIIIGVIAGIYNVWYTFIKRSQQ